MIDDILNRVTNKKSLVENLKENQNKTSHLKDLYQLIQENNYVGEVVELHYKNAIIQVNDHHRQKVGGIPSQGF